MTKKYILMFLVVVSLGLFSYNLYDSNHFLPFKCLYVTDYYFSDKGKLEGIHLTQDLSIESPSSAYFLMNGTVQEDAKEYNISRTIFMDEGQIEQGHGATLRFKIKSVDKTSEDNLPEKIFEKIMQEYTISHDIFQLQIFHLDHMTYLLSGTFSYVSLCIRY